ncbi:MAG: serine hydrolase [Clostridia bacterium]|nr:serine hydrolase [Clostridia bacterium]
MSRQEHLQASIDSAATSAGGRVAVCVLDLEGRTWAAREAEALFPAASLAKLPILVEVFRQVARGALSWEEMVRVPPAACVSGSGVLPLLRPGVRLSLWDLAALMVAVSDNTAANLLLERVTPEAVNATLAGLGLTATRVENPFQVVPHPPVGRNLVTAGEMARLLLAVARGEVVSWDACRRMMALLKGQQHNEGLPALLPPPAGWPGETPEWELAHKTGWLTGAYHDAGVLYRRGSALVVAVCTEGVGWPGGGPRLAALVGRACYDALA